MTEKNDATMKDFEHLFNGELKGPPLTPEQEALMTDQLKELNEIMERKQSE